MKIWTKHHYDSKKVLNAIDINISISSITIVMARSMLRTRDLKILTNIFKKDLIFSTGSSHPCFYSRRSIDSIKMLKMYLDNLSSSGRFLNIVTEMKRELFRSWK